MKIALMDIKRQHEEHAQEYENVAIEVLRSGKYILGENVTKFEKEFSSYCGVKHAIGVGNGTDALQIALKSLGIGFGDEVITCPFTFFATAEAIATVGAKIVFVDVDPSTYCINVNKIESVITEKTKAILPIHFYGQPSNMDKINEIAEKHNLFVIEDSCQAAGSSYKGKKTGSLGTVGCFSFFPTKTLGCDGDGGMITTNDDSIADACRALRVHGSGIHGLNTYNLLNSEQKDLDPNIDIDLTSPKYYNFVIGQNSRLDELQAAILRKKLSYLDDFVERRRNNAKLYDDRLRDTEYIIPKTNTETIHSYYLYVLSHPNAKKIMNYLKNEGIGVGVYYPVSLHNQKALSNLGYKIGDFPESEKLSKTTFAIPVFPELLESEKEYIVSKLLEALEI
ncbi:DegT/DnrJ/EryC1/StrS family aminotransferase [bacterium]|nr:DegT/DnrJ/EryC1/StrS family aminotransferase [bacterium]